MRRAALLLALSTAGLSSCAAFTTAPEPDPHEQLHAGVLALEANQYAQARAVLEPLFEERWDEPVGQHAMLALVAADLDTRNPERRLWQAADRAARLLNVPDLPAWMLPVAESYYVVALELGAQEQRLAEAEAAQAAAERRAARAEGGQRASSGRTLPPPPAQTVPGRIRRLEGERTTLQQRLSQAEQQLSTRERELRETKAELERIKRTIKP